jgi:hypothetical protein
MGSADKAHPHCENSTTCTAPLHLAAAANWPASTSRKVWTRNRTHDLPANRPRGSGVILQVLEETGYDIRPLAINDKAHYVHSTIASGGSRKPLGLFIVPGVDEMFPFAQQCEGEIEGFCWFHIDDLARVVVGSATLSAGRGGGRVRLFQVRPTCSGSGMLFSMLFSRRGVGRGGVVPHVPAACPSSQAAWRARLRAQWRSQQVRRICSIPAARVGGADFEQRSCIQMCHMPFVIVA